MDFKQWGFQTASYKPRRHLKKEMLPDVEMTLSWLVCRYLKSTTCSIKKLTGKIKRSCPK